MARSKSGRKAWLMVPSLMFPLALVAGCNTEEAAPTSAPTKTAPIPRPVPPNANPIEPGKTSKVEEDLKKDLGGPVLKPDTAAPATAPEKKP